MMDLSITPLERVAGALARGLVARALAPVAAAARARAGEVALRAQHPLGNGGAAVVPDIQRPVEAGVHAARARQSGERELAREVQRVGRRARRRHELEGHLELAAGLHLAEVPDERAVHDGGDRAHLGAQGVGLGRHAGGQGQREDEVRDRRLGGRLAGVERRGVAACVDSKGV